MASQPGSSPYGSPQPKRSARGAIIAACLAFVAGGALAGWATWSYVGPDATPAPISPLAAVDAVRTPAPAAPSPTAAALAAPASEPAALDPAQQGGIDQRLAAAEQRLTRLDLQAQAAAGNAARAESLLIAFATRRSVERGGELGYLADQLRLRFGDKWPNAVATIIDFARTPVRLDSLVARLDGLGPQLQESSEGPSWQAFRREIKELFVFRRENTPSPQPERRLERARWALEQGRYQAAIDEVKAMPGVAKAQGWVLDAERYKKAMEALEVIETAAVLDERGLREGAGNPVRAVSPAGVP
jgi:hypothetical protein